MSVARMSYVRRLSCLWVLLLVNRVTAAPPPSLPQSPNAWVNSQPISLEQLKGKGVFLWFFEETCPNTLATWRQMIELSQIYEDKPIVFIGVNSGNSRKDIQEYVDQHKVKWPVIVDVDRQFEEACKISTISLRNISQVAYVSHDGEFHIGHWSAMKETIDDAMKGAHWKIDPAQIPGPLTATWRGMEFGNYKGAGSTINKFMLSPKEDVAAAARKLKSSLEDAMSVEIEDAKSKSENGNEWLAYEQCEKIAEQFRGSELPPEITSLKKDLAKQSAIKSGIAARKLIDAATKNVQAGKPLSKKLKSSLAKVLEDFPDSALALNAQALLDHSGDRSVDQLEE